MSGQLPLVLSQHTADDILRDRIAELERRLATEAARHDHESSIATLRELARLRQMVHRPAKGTS